MKNKSIIIKVSIILLFLLVGAVLGYIIFNDKFSFFKANNKGNEQQQKEKEKEKEKEEELPPPAPKLKIIDLESKTRPISLMIDNETGALPQAGLQDAFLIYEILIEGGETRFLAIFKDKDTKMIGPIRSTRHYFLDYGLENDVIFTHFGYSPQAISDIGLLGVNNISGTQADGGAFWREKPLGGWHNVFTKMSNLMERANIKKYRTTSYEKPLLNYSAEEINFDADENVKLANYVRIEYSSAHNVTYEYDSELKVYKRSMRGKPHVDRVTGEQYTFKNIIVYNIRNYPLNDGSGKGRIGLDNIGSGDGYYITNGNAIPIKWKKTSRAVKTTYTDLLGNEIKVNDGNTFIHLQPLNKKLTIQ